jgi:hypothetical protein
VRLFPAELEERAFRCGLVRDWKSAGLVSAESAAKLADSVGPAPERAAWPLRLVLFGFSALCFGALVALFLKDFNDRAIVGVGCLIAAAAAIAAAETLIRAFAFHRHGVEEALVASAVGLAAFAAERLVGRGAGWHFSTAVFASTLTAAAALAYARYGYRLAAIAVAGGLGLLVVAFDAGERETRVLLAALYAALLAAVTLAPGLPRRERERLELGRFFLALSVPLVLNLRLEHLAGGYDSYGRAALDAFSRATLAAIFAIPAAWLAWGLASRARALIWAGALGLLVAQCSVKPYLGIARHSWDPALLGLELIVAAYALKRWLDAGPGGRRGAYSSEDAGGERGGGALGLLAGAIAAAPASAPAGPGAPRGHGGGFGGGGASGSY